MSQKFPKKYYFDIKVRRIRSFFKGIAPTRVIPLFSRQENLLNTYSSLNAEEVYPWTSPNIWVEIVKFYSGITEPVVFEYGTGASSIAHIDNLVNLNGTYIGVESDRTWFDIVFQSIVKRISTSEDEVQIKHSMIDRGSNDDFDLLISTCRVKIILKFRSNKEGYISALNDSCNVAIVDGKHRIECVNRILDTDFLVETGLLALMEAGRGSTNWWEGDLTGDNDYSSVVRQLMNLGGKIIDGNGVDNWPNLYQRSPNPISYYYPKEACILIRSNNSIC